MAVEYTTHDGVAVLTLNNAPVNGLGFATRAGIVEGLARALADDSLKAVVLCGAGKVFSAGADISEFNTPQATREPMLGTVIAALEASPKPVVAALHGVAMGGGLELALGAHYRVAAPGTQIALPEVKLGLLPGAGGTQRLPRAIGLEAALNIIISGTSVPAGRLGDTALFDGIAEDALLDAALALARRAGAQAGPHPRLRERPIEHPNAEGFIQFVRNNIPLASRHFPAPQRCIEAVAHGVKHGFAAGLVRERECFVALLQTPESRALRHAFFSERAAGKIADVPPTTPTREIRQVAVIGAGTMGTGIALSLLDAGLPVTLLEAGQEALERGVAALHQHYAARVGNGKLKPEAAQARLAQLAPTLDNADLKNADLIIEAVFEELDLKQRVFAQLDAVAKPGAILASNTSTLDLNRIAAFTRRPQDVLGLHFFSPANRMKLLEVVRGAATGKDVLATAMKLAKTIGKTAVVSGVCDGFIGNRMIEQYLRQAFFLLEEGALPQQVDQALEQFGFATGPFRVSDLAGNDIGWAIRRRRYQESPAMKYSKIADRLCEMGRFGQKTGGGWYDYVASERQARESDLVNGMILAYSKEAGLARRKIDAAEIVERLVLVLVNEGAKILAEGIAAKASDIDMVYLAGYGFPVWRGGPMLYADTLGLFNVARTLDYYARRLNGDALQPAPLVRQLAAAGRSFNP